MTEQHGSVLRDLQRWAGTTGPGAEAARCSLDWWTQTLHFYCWYWNAAPMLSIDAAYRLYHAFAEDRRH